VLGWKEYEHNIIPRIIHHQLSKKVTLEFTCIDFAFAEYSVPVFVCSGDRCCSWVVVEVKRLQKLKLKVEGPFLMF